MGGDSWLLVFFFVNFVAALFSGAFFLGSLFGVGLVYGHVIYTWLTLYYRQSRGFDTSRLSEKL